MEFKKFHITRKIILTSEQKGKIVKNELEKIK